MFSTNQQYLDIEKAFDHARLIDIDSLEGCYRGQALSLPGLRYLPAGVYRAMMRIVNSPLINFVWKGKYFHLQQGANLWFLCSTRWVFARYQYYYHNNDILLNYHVTENPGFLHQLSARLRQLDSSPQVLIGQVIINNRPVMFFSLTAIEERCNAL